MEEQDKIKYGCDCCQLSYNYSESDCYANIDWIKKRNNDINKLINRLQSDIVNYQKEINENLLTKNKFDTHLLNQYSNYQKSLKNEN